MTSSKKLQEIYKKKAKARNDLKDKLYKRQHFKCFYCKTIIKRLCLGNIDHVVPLSKGGTSKEENLVFTCFECNARKADKMPNEFNK